ANSVIFRLTDQESYIFIKSHFLGKLKQRDFKVFYLNFACLYVTPMQWDVDLCLYMGVVECST
ncbi:MAG: hypothetical protein J6U94_04760, partial [Paludibacteraceae bacterium]|nr:hypothetical protein [Paludibacteraceae bacterium]